MPTGHAYVETIAKMLKITDPKMIIPIHTEHPDDFASIPAFAPYQDRVRVLRDGIRLSLE